MKDDSPSGLIAEALALFGGRLVNSEGLPLHPPGRSQPLELGQYIVRYRSQCPPVTLPGIGLSSSRPFCAPVGHDLEPCPPQMPPLQGGRWGAVRQRGLSTCHNAARLGEGDTKPRTGKGETRPFMRVFLGGSLCELKSGERQPLGSKPLKRGQIVEFSAKSRRRLMRLVAGQLQAEALPLFVTLTYPDKFPHDLRTQRRHLENWFARLVRVCPEASAVWKREWKQRQSGDNAGAVAPHFHLLLYGVPDEIEAPQAVTLQRKFAFAHQLGWWRDWREVSRERSVDGHLVEREEHWWGQDKSAEVREYRRSYIPEKGRNQGKQVVEVTRYARAPLGEWEDSTRSNDREWGREVGGVWESPKIPLQNWVSVAWAEVVRSDDPRHVKAGTSVERVRSREGVAYYASKYICKADEAEAVAQFGGTIGRTWGILGRGRLPWAEVLELELSEEQRKRILRISRRYVQSGYRRRGKKWRLRASVRSFTWFCSSPEFWVSSLGSALGVVVPIQPINGEQLPLWDG